MVTPKIPDFSTHNFKGWTSGEDCTMKYHKCAHCGLVVFESVRLLGGERGLEVSAHTLEVSAHTFEEEGEYTLSPEEVTCEEWARYSAIRYVIT